MKIYFIAVLLASSLSFGQSGNNFYEIKNLGTNYTMEELDSAMLAANFCHFFFEDKRRAMNFNDGSVVELLHKGELVGYEDTCFVSSANQRSNEYWEISSTGTLIRRLQIRGK